MNLKGLKINFLGDSITQGYGASCPDNVYHALLKKELELSEARNYGISGTRFATQKGTEKRPKDNWVDVNAFTERFDKMEDADLIVVFGGTNDYGHGDAPFGEFSDRTPDTFYGACHYLFSELIKKYLGKPIIIMTPLHRIGELEGCKEKPVEEKRPLIDYVNAIREVAEFYSLPVLDLFKESGIQPEIAEIKEGFMPDGLHPNDRGHRIMADKLKKFLEVL